MRLAVSIATAVWVVGGCTSATSGDAAADPPDTMAPDVFYAFDTGSCGDGGVGVPDALRACTTAGECAIAAEFVDRCGSFVAHGIRQDAWASFRFAAFTCRPSLSACDGLSFAATADDGQTAPMGGVEVFCEAGLCTTHVRSPANCGLWTCASSQLCVSTCRGGDGGIVDNFVCVDVPSTCTSRFDCACIAASNPRVYCSSGYLCAG